MNQQNDSIPAGGEVRTPAHPPADKPAREATEQAPLGKRPQYEELLDTAVDYTFPCSDPIAVDQSCADAEDAPRGASQGPSI